MKSLKKNSVISAMCAVWPLIAGDESQGDQTPNFRESLPEDLRGNSVFDNVKDLTDLATQFANAQSFLGSSIRIPSENASEEDRKKFYEKVMKHAPSLMPKPDPADETAVQTVLAALGRPADPSSYNIEGAQLSDDLKKAAHEAGLTQNQFAKMYQTLIKPSLDSSAARAAEVEKGRAELAKEWGYAFQVKEQTAQALLQKTGAPAELVDAAAKGQLNANTLRWLDQLATSIGREGLDLVNHGQGGNRMTPAEAQAQINEIMNNRSHAYWNTSDPAHKQAVKDVVDLHRVMGR